MAESITKILVPVDFSAHADRAFNYAVTVAQRFGASLTLVHVVEDPYVTGAWSNEVYMPNLGEILEALVADAERRLAALKQSVTAPELTIETAVIAGRPAPAIVEHATTGGYDLIVMGTRGRTGLSHLVMGSVAERVLRKAPCPVLTVHATSVASATREAAA